MTQLPRTPSHPADSPLFAPGLARRDGSATMHAAARDIAPTAGALRERVYAAIRDGGRTCDEVEQTTGMSHQTASARIRELVTKKRVRASKHTRPTRSGRRAIVWEIAP